MVWGSANSLQARDGWSAGFNADLTYSVQMGTRRFASMAKRTDTNRRPKWFLRDPRTIAPFSPKLSQRSTRCRPGAISRDAKTAEIAPGNSRSEISADSQHQAGVCG